MCSEEQFHHFNHSVRNVAIIGSGPSGTPAARQLRDAGLNVRVFERQDKPGGIWNWRPSASLPLAVPTPPPSVGAFTPVIRGTGVYGDPGRVERARFNPPNPCYWSLNNNVPTSTMAVSFFSHTFGIRCLILLQFKDFPYPLEPKLMSLTPTSHPMSKAMSSIMASTSLLPTTQEWNGQKRLATFGN